jgi:Cft2 family RNA processing exonuclease
MKLTFLGGAATVTGSKFLLESAGERILVDCGLFQGYKHLRKKNRESLAVDPASIDTVILTHAHLDHSGWLPLLVRDGFRGHILTTAGTRDLCSILLPDSGRIQEEDARLANRKGFSRHTPALPLYTEADAHRALESFHAVPRESWMSIGKEWKYRLHRAGHIVGASIVEVRTGTSSVLSGYQAGGTRGADLVGGARSVKIHGAWVPVAAEVRVLDSLSAHADAGETLSWLGSFTSVPARTFIVHGEPDAADSLRRKIQGELGWQAVVPELGDSAEWTAG